MEKKAILAQYFMQQGIYAAADQEKAIVDLAATYPKASADEKGLTDVVDIAYEAYLLITGGADDKNPAETKPATGNGTEPESTVSAAEKQFINTKLRAEKPARQQKTRATKITKLLLSKPAPATYIAADATGTLKVESFKNIQEKIASGKYVVEADDPAGTENGLASTTNYNLIVAASQNPEQHPLAVHIGDLNKRPVGYLIETLDATGANSSAVQMTRAEFEKFLILQTEGYVMAASADMPGAMIKYVDAKESTRHAGQIIEAHAVVVDKNKKEAIAANHYDIVSVASATGKKKATVKSELAFRVSLPGEKTTDGVIKKRTIRVSLEIEIPEFDSKPMYADKFEVKKDTTWTEAPDAKTAQKIREDQIKAIANLTQALQGTDGTLDEYADDISKFIKPATQAPTVNI